MFRSLLFFIFLYSHLDATSFFSKCDHWNVQWIQNGPCNYDILRLEPKSACPYSDLKVQWISTMCGEVRCIIALYLCPLDADPLNEVVLLVQSPSGSVELHGVLELGGQTVLLYPEDSDWLINLFWNEPWVRITHGIYDTTISSQGFRSAYNMFYKRRLLIQER